MKKETCCDDEINHVDDDSEDIICPSCKEHTCPVICTECGEIVFESACCG